MNWKNPNCIAGGSPAAGNFLLHRQKKVTKEKATPVRRLPLRSSAKPGAAQLARSALKLVCELGAPDSDSRSVEREGAQAAAGSIVKRGAIAAAPALNSFAHRVAAAPLFGFLTWRLTGGSKAQN